jgi:anionic cell wall polymer biosynthesis LytR-Cps2A-Psr (LCP) family protein
LVIDVPAGHRRLNGALAEGLVRYRGYAAGDLARNQVQMDFMKTLLNQVLTREAIMNDPWELIRVVIEDVSTNMTIPNMVRYVPYITSASADKVTSFTMPGTDGYRRGAGSVFIPCPDSMHEVAFEVFYANTEPPEPPEPPEPNEGI